MIIADNMMRCVMLVLVASTCLALVYNQVKVKRVVPFRGGRKRVARCSRESPSSEAEAKVKEQLGYLPRNMVRVAAWTSDGWPATIEASPIRRDNKDVAVPFPTLYWLTDQRLSTSISNIERDGGVQEARDFIQEQDKVGLLLASQERYKQRRRELLTKDDTALLELRGWQLYGIAGIRHVEAVKCLHAHFAHFISDQTEPRNPIGAWTYDRLPPEIKALCPAS